jgi:hypothetical protein
MKKSASLLTAGLVLSSIMLSHGAAAQEKATPQELMQKVREAAGDLSKKGDAGVSEFASKPSPWVWKDTYIVVLDCSKGVMAANPIKPELVGKPLTALKDVKGNPAFELLCAATANPNGVWAEYWVPKPGEKEGSRKISYGSSATGTPYMVAAGVFADQPTLADLTKLVAK